MGDSDKDRRLSEASDLHRAFESLCNVSPLERQGFVHDRLMSNIDDICKNVATSNRPPFTAAQMEVLKDISFRIVYILDPLNRPQKSFFGGLKREFSEKSPMEKLGYVVKAALFIIPFFGGVYHFGQKAYDFVVENNGAITIQYSSGQKAGEQNGSAQASQPSVPPAQTPSHQLPLMVK
jgi:hypothetical protein